MRRKSYNFEDLPLESQYNVLMNEAGWVADAPDAYGYPELEEAVARCKGKIDFMATLQYLVDNYREQLAEIAGRSQYYKDGELICQ